MEVMKFNEKTRNALYVRRVLKIYHFPFDTLKWGFEHRQIRDNKNKESPRILKPGGY